MLERLRFKLFYRLRLCIEVVIFDSYFLLLSMAHVYGLNLCVHSVV